MTDSDLSQEVRRMARALAAHVEWLGQSGVSALPRWDGGALSRAASSALSVAVEEDAPDAPTATAPSFAERSASVVDRLSSPVEGLASKAERLIALRDEIGECRRCRLAQGRTKLVFGVGNAEARLLFVGEGPGRDEDLQGEPFVGKAGQLLTDIIEKGMRLRRADVYICNVVKCRPPDNRDPEPDEVAACGGFLARQVEIVGPEVIVALGRFAAQALLATSTPIGRLRGRWQSYRGIPVMPTLHPAYLLRNPGDKRLVWEDVKQVMQKLDIAPRPA
jgi:uracil-DNA glycosylase